MRKTTKVDLRYIAAGLGAEQARAVAAGDEGALLQSLWFLVRAWLRAGGSCLEARPALSASVSVARPAEERVFLAAGCDLYDLLMLSPQGREAVLKLGLEPLLEEPESE